jgi:hypothetical protein
MCYSLILRNAKYDNEHKLITQELKKCGFEFMTTKIVCYINKISQCIIVNAHVLNDQEQRQLFEAIHEKFNKHVRVSNENGVILIKNIDDCSLYKCQEIIHRTFSIYPKFWGSYPKEHGLGFVVRW